MRSLPGSREDDKKIAFVKWKNKTLWQIIFSRRTETSTAIRLNPTLTSDPRASIIPSSSSGCTFSQRLFSFPSLKMEMMPSYSLLPHQESMFVPFVTFTSSTGCTFNIHTWVNLSPAWRRSPGSFSALMFRFSRSNKMQKRSAEKRKKKSSLKDFERRRRILINFPRVGRGREWSLCLI